MSQRARYSTTMAPLQVEPIFYNGLPTPEGSMKAHSDLADSPIDEEDTTSRSDSLSQEGDRFVPIQKPAKQSPSNKKPKSSGKQSNSAFRFVVVDHPNQLRDRQEMRENRMHVMHDYLNKERKRPESRDTRVNGSARSNRKQKDLGSPPMKAGAGLALPVNNFKVDVSRLTPSDSMGSECSSDRESAERSAKRPAPTSKSKGASGGEPAALIRRVYNPPIDDQRLVSGIGGRWQYSDYMKTTPNDIPATPGSRVDPFYQLPPLIDPTLDVNALKWSCSQRFGSDKLAQNWIPALLRARHAFLSTLCISSSHDAIMSRALAPANVQSSAKNIQRWKVKRDVISLLTEAMKDPELQVADETMVSVVHLLVSDIMGCDDRDLKIHQDGLINMATARGGLDKLGIGGELAAIMTIMNYLIAAVREIQPHRDYIKFATTIAENSPKPDDSTLLPESPVYCGPNGFKTIHRVVSPCSDIDELLTTVQALTNQFYIDNGRNSPGPSNPARFWEPSHETVSSLRDKVFSFQPARDKEFNDMNERYTYESIRLTSLVYAHALANRIPISKAAEELSKQNSSSSTTTSPGRKNSDPSHNADKLPSMAIQIKYALVRTDISFCWDHMGGVLFWVALVGGAAANPGPYAEQERWGEEEDARKFLAAIAVRCCVVLSFQYGAAILEMLRRLVMIETALQQGSWEQEEEADVVVEIPEMKSVSPVDSIWDVPGALPQFGSFGPTPPSEMQKGFSDFVLDFMSSGQL